MAVLARTETHGDTMAPILNKGSERGVAWVKDRLMGLRLTQRKVCQQVGISEDKLSKSISGKREWTETEELAVARALKISVEELRYRTGYSDERPESLPAAPPATVTVEAVGWIDAKGAVHLEQGAEPPAPLPPDMASGFTAIDTYVGWAEGWWLHGATMYVERRSDVPADVAGKLCVVRLPDRSMKLRVVHPGGRPGTWRLHLVSGEPDGGDTVLASAGPVILTRHPTR